MQSSGSAPQGASMSFITTGAPTSAPSVSAPAAGSADPAALLAQSPFAALLNVPGITPESLLASFSPNGSGGGVDPLAALGGAANPFAGLVGANNPFAGLIPGGVNPFDSLVGAGNPFASSGNPFTNAGGPSST